MESVASSSEYVQTQLFFSKLLCIFQKAQVVCHFMGEVLSDSCSIIDIFT